jgi:cell division protein FtsI/penicillin-binding protein 2
MKAVTMTAALDQGLITPNTTLNDTGYLTFKDGTAPVTNWNYQRYGPETMTQVLEHSANVGAAYVAHDILGPERYYPYLASFGFGKSTGIDGAEEAGFYRTPASKGWTPSDLARQAFGQSISATSFQVAMAYQAIANAGVLMKPYLVAAVDDNGRVSSTQPQELHRVMNVQTAKMLADMLTQVAVYNHHAIADYSIAIKTGTATTVGVSDDLTEASMVGFVPATNPQYVILVKLDRPQSTIYGGGAAGPLWKAIAQQLMWHFAVPPDQQK